jgi:hypothetical protein
LNAAPRINHDRYLSACHHDHVGDFCRSLRRFSVLPAWSWLWAGLPNRAQAERAVRRNRIGIPEGSAT